MSPLNRQKLIVVHHKYNLHSLDNNNNNKNDDDFYISEYLIIVEKHARNYTVPKKLMKKNKNNIKDEKMHKIQNKILQYINK